MIKGDFYVVKKGKNPGIYLDADVYNDNLRGYPGGEGKKLRTLSEAYLYLTDEKEIDYTIPSPILNNYFDKTNDLRVYYIVCEDNFQGLLVNKVDALKYTNNYIEVIGYENARQVFDKVQRIKKYTELDEDYNSKYYIILNSYYDVLTNNPMKMIEALDGESTVLYFNNKKEAEYQYSILKKKKFYSNDIIYIKSLLKSMLNKEDKQFIYQVAMNNEGSNIDIVYTDGSYSLVNNLIGSGVLYKSSNLIFMHSSYQKNMDEGEFLFSSSYAEIRAVIIAIEAAILAGKDKIIIHHDLKNLNDDGDNKMININKLYFAYYQYLDIARTVIDIEFKHVKAHSDVTLHNIVDKICSIKNI